jgi:hypothetical protein
MNYWGSLFLTFWRLEGGWECTIEDAVEKAAETHSVGEMMFDACSKLAAAERAYEDETNRDFVKLEKVIFWRSFPDIIWSTEHDSHWGHGDANESLEVAKRRLEDDAKLGEERAMGPEGEGWWRGVDRSG